MPEAETLIDRVDEEPLDGGGGRRAAEKNQPQQKFQWFFAIVGGCGCSMVNSNERRAYEQRIPQRRVVEQAQVVCGE